MYSAFVFAAASAVIAATVPASWLDATSPSATWIVAGASIPAAPHEKPLYDLPHPCVPRVPATAQDRAVVAAGWRLIGPNEQYGRTELNFGTANYDGMCRAVDYQAFVFFNGKFVGTLSPGLMSERADGSLNYYSGAAFYTETEFAVSYARYSDSDPSCCPHKTVSLTMRVDSGKLSIQQF